MNEMVLLGNMPSLVVDSRSRISLSRSGNDCTTIIMDYGNKGKIRQRNSLIIRMNELRIYDYFASRQEPRGKKNKKIVSEPEI